MALDTYIKNVKKKKYYFENNKIEAKKIRIDIN